MVSFKRDDKLFQRDIYRFDFRSNFLVFIYSAKHWKGKIKSSLNDIFIVPISILFITFKRLITSF